MKKALVVLVLTMFLLSGIAFANESEAQTGEVVEVTLFETTATTPVLISEDVEVEIEVETEDDPGITPDSPLYGLDVALDRLALFFTYGRAKRAEKGIEIARERLAEASAMTLKKKMDAAERAEAEHAKEIAKVRDLLDEAENNKTQDIEITLKIEKELEFHEGRVARVKEKIELEVESRLTPEQLKRAKAMLAKLKSNVDEVLAKTAAKKIRIKNEIKTRLNLSDADIEEKIRGIEAKVKESFKSKAELEINKTLETMDRVIEFHGKKANATEAEVEAVDAALKKAKYILENAQDAYAEGEYVQAVKLAMEARVVALQSKRGMLVKTLIESEAFKARIENIGKKLDAARDAVSEGGTVSTRIRESVKIGGGELKERVDLISKNIETRVLAIKEARSTLIKDTVANKNEDSLEEPGNDLSLDANEVGRDSSTISSRS